MFNCKTKFNLKNRTCQTCLTNFKPTGINQKFCNNCQKINRKIWEEKYHALIYTKLRRIKRDFNFHFKLGKYEFNIGLNFQVKFRPKNRRN